MTRRKRPKQLARRRLVRSDAGVVLDTGALLEIERGTPWLRALLAEVHAAGGEIAIPAGVLAQALRGHTSARIARLAAARESDVLPLDDVSARAVGEILAVTGTEDVVDASVVLTARSRGHPIVTSNGPDFRRLDPSARLVRADSGQPI